MNNSTTIRLKCGITLLFISILAIGPIPITSTLGAFVALFRPRWFHTLTKHIYNQQAYPSNLDAQNSLTDSRDEIKNRPQSVNNSSFTPRLQLFLAMLILMLIDIGPIPVASLIALFIVLFRPHWFLKLMARIYQNKA